MVLFILLLFAFAFLMVVVHQDIINEYKENKGKTTLPDIESSIVDLIAVSMRADGEVTKAELAKVKRFLLRGFGEERALGMLHKLRDTLRSSYITDIRLQCLQINQKLSYKQKLALLSLFFSVAATEPLKSAEVRFLKLYARYTRINPNDFELVRNHYFAISDWTAGAKMEDSSEQEREEKAQVEQKVSKNEWEEAYKTLSLPTNATQEQVKRAYRKLAMQWHPDRFESKSEAEKAYATKMFREINQAYHRICG